MRQGQPRDDAAGCLPTCLHLPRLSAAGEPAARRLLRVLLLRRHPLPADAVELAEPAVDPPQQRAEDSRPIESTFDYPAGDTPPDALLAGCPVRLLEVTGARGEGMSAAAADRDFRTVTEMHQPLGRSRASAAPAAGHWRTSCVVIDGCQDATPIRSRPVYG